MRLLTATAIALTIITTTARADDLVVYGAGSLREATRRWCNFRPISRLGRSMVWQY